MRARGRVPEGVHMLTQRAQVPAPIAYLPVPVVPKKIAAQYLGIALKTLEDWLAEGTGPKAVRYQEGGNVYFRLVTLDQFIVDHER
jgi:hypothetical protein